MNKKIKELSNKLISARVCGTTDEIAEYLYDAGYRKVEWISVKDRLPNKDELVLCIGAKGGMFLGTHLRLCKDGIRASAIVPNSPCVRYAIYWMPLPEAPKMKGELYERDFI